MAELLRPAHETEFSSEIVGTLGKFFDPMLRIPDERWFSEFRKKMGNFAWFGEITNPEVVRRLGMVAGLHTLAAPVM